MPINAATRYIALIGDPVEHSMTPVLQNAALDELGVNLRNVAFRVAPDQLREAVYGARALGILGLMVTIPHKEAVMEFCDEVDRFGELMGAVNLLHFSGTSIVGYNTDGYGASQSLADAGIPVKGSRILVIGAGGAGRCLAHRFCLDGAAQVALLNRTVSRAEAIRDEIRTKQGKTIHIGPLTPEGLETAMQTAQVVVNATSVGMYPHTDSSPVPAHLWRPDHIAFDIVYNPLETRFLADARKAGAVTVDGVGMLVYTNEKAIEICAGFHPSIDTMREACIQALHASTGQA